MASLVTVAASAPGTLPAGITRTADGAGGLIKKGTETIDKVKDLFRKKSE